VNDGHEDGGSSTDAIKGFDHLSPGARFFRADMHIHSYGVSADVTDSEMTVGGIVAGARARGLELIAITDHNAIDSVEPLLTLAATEGLTAFPGVELTSAEGHVLVYFPPEDMAGFRQWFAALDFIDGAQEGDRHVLTPIHGLLEEVKKAGGVAVPAHIARANTGFEQKVSAQSRQAIITSPALVAIEIDKPEETSLYSLKDQGDGAEQRRALLARRAAELGEAEGRGPAKLLFSDAHSRDQIGRDRQGRERVTRIKMTEPSFAAFRTALADPEARIKLEDEVGFDYPRIIGARFIGGFLDQREIVFSPNLTCLIGGRGAGKSTALESVRAACLSTVSEIDGKPNCPETMHLVYRDEYGTLHYLKRDSEKTTYELGGGGAVEATVPVEGYGQDRVASIIRGYPDEPRPLLAFLDQFVDLDEIDAELVELAERLAASAAAIAPLAGVPKRKEEAEKRLAETRVKLKALGDSNLKTALEWRQKLQRERRLRDRLEERLKEIDDAIDSLDVSLHPGQLAGTAEVDLETTPSAALLMGENDDPGLVSELVSLADSLKKDKDDLAAELAGMRPKITVRFQEWKARDQRIEAKVQEVLSELRKQGIEPDLGAMNRLTADEGKYLAAIREADTQVADLKAKESERKVLLNTYRTAQSRRFQLRSEAMRQLTEKLNGAFEEFKVKVGFNEAGLVEEYCDRVRSRIGNRFFKNARLTEFCQAISPIDLAAAVRRGDGGVLTALADQEQQPFFRSSDEASEFLATIGQPEVAALEQIARDDSPEITLTTFGGEVQTVRFENLSFGQKASILLGALLFSSEQTPLIIDQPEDHLDSQFIARTVVAVLRRIKESRQVIIATHNANIAVLGDAEQIVPMQGYGGVGHIKDVGAVDSPETRKRACEILEGGDAAYRKRGEMYGFEVARP
jgi:ABC-type cobalamin/Fe3+-siderophores transport system ATPase subunit